MNNNTLRENSGALRVRKDFYELSDEEINTLRKAYAGLYAISDASLDDERGYQWIAGVHGFPVPVYCTHGPIEFPAWHRAYIYEFELRLQAIEPAVMLPYWDWTSDRAIAEGIPDAIAAPSYVDPDSGDTLPNPLASAFSQVTGGPTARNPDGSDELANLKTQIAFAQGRETYPDYSPALENPHGGLHVWVGGDMGSVPVASYDPIFWMHHCNVDRLWWEWQEVNGSDTVPQSVRDFICAPFTYTGEQTLDTAYFGYTYADGDSVGMVDDAFRTSLAATLPGTMTVQLPNVRQAFRSARLEFYGLRKTRESYRVHLYCDADEVVYDAARARPGDGSYANTLYLFGHGQCGGGPGHCERTARSRYDRRPPHHLTPYNTYVDVTDTVRKETAKGVRDIVLSIVVTNDHGEQVSPAVLEFEAVSLTTRR